MPHSTQYRYQTAFFRSLYSRHLLDELSSPGTEGFSSFHIILHTMSPLIPRR
jgi:hypothetical protein